jgi:hypothetical protein
MNPDRHRPGVSNPAIGVAISMTNGHSSTPLPSSRASCSEGAQRDGKLTPLLQRVTKLVGEDGGPIRTLLPILGEAAIDRLRQASWNHRRNGTKGRGRLGHLFGEHFGRLLRLERQTTGAGEVADDAEGIEIAAPVDRFAQRLFGTHELGRANHLSGAERTCARDHTRDAEIGDQYAAAIFEQDVVRLHVPVDHALAVRVRERPRDVAQHTRAIGRGQRTTPPHAFGQFRPT